MHACTVLWQTCHPAEWRSSRTSLSKRVYCFDGSRRSSHKRCSVNGASVSNSCSMPRNRLRSCAGVSPFAVGGAGPTCA